MAGMFDDLIPGKAPGMSFDDLIPKIGSEAAARGPMDPARMSLNEFGSPLASSQFGQGPQPVMRRREPGKPFNVLPFREDENGTVSFDINAGLPGALIRAVKAPYDALTGQLDPLSPEGQARAREAATFMTPMNPAVRAGDFAVPGVLRSTRRATVETPTADELKAAANQGYTAARATGAQYSGQGVGELSNGMQRSLNEEGFIAELAPKTFAVLNKLANPPEGSVVTISSLDAARKALNRVAPNPQDNTDFEAARRAIEGLDAFIERMGGSSKASSMAGPAPAADAGAAYLSGPGGAAATTPEAEAARLIRDARGNAAANFRSGRVTGAEEAADLRAAAANSGQNIGNSLRQRLASILLSDKQSRGFSPKELTAMRQVVEGTATADTLRYVSNLLGGGGGIGQTGIAALGGATGAAVGGAPGAALGATLPPLAGAMSRSAYNGLVGRQVRNLAELVRQRSPLYQQRLAASPLLPERSDQSAGLLLRGMLGMPGGLLGDPNQR